MSIRETLRDNAELKFKKHTVLDIIYKCLYSIYLLLVSTARHEILKWRRVTLREAHSSNLASPTTTSRTFRGARERKILK